MKKSFPLHKILTYVCCLLAIALLVCQFLPGYWVAEEDSASVFQLVGFPGEHDDVADFILDQFEKNHTLNEMAWFSLLTMILCILTPIFSVKTPESMTATVLTLLAGIASVYTYITGTELQLGNAWMLHLIIAIVLLVVAVLRLVSLIIYNKKNK